MGRIAMRSASRCAEAPANSDIEYGWRSPPPLHAIDRRSPRANAVRTTAALLAPVFADAVDTHFTEFNHYPTFVARAVTVDPLCLMPIVTGAFQ